MALFLYIVGSAVTLGGLRYKYMKTEETLDGECTENINYDLIRENLKSNIVNSSKSLGITFSDKCDTIIKICKEKCGKDCSKVGKKNRQKMMRYIREYERIGEEAFIKSHISKSKVIKL